MSEDKVIKISGLVLGYKTKKLGASVVLEDLNLSVSRGEFIAVLGPNGCGKSTLLRTIAGIQKPLKGSILLEGKPIGETERAEAAKIISIALTENMVMGDISVYALVSMGRYPHSNWLGILSHEDFKIIDHALEVTGLSSYRDKNFMELSDGLKQKAVIARALAQDTPVILFDEPTAFLDITSKLEIMRMLKVLAGKFNKSVILSTHDLDLALQTADTIWLITKDKKIQVGIPEELVLNGRFEEAFNRNDIKFQVEKGIFKFEHTALARVRLEGNGPEAFWTERALDRIGIDSNCAGENCALIEVINEHGNPLWLFAAKQAKKEFNSLADLIQFLRNYNFTD